MTEPMESIEWIWLNGSILPLAEARVGIEDRGFQFADGVYEVIRLYAGVPFTLTEHLGRLARSCQGVKINLPMDVSTLAGQIRLLIARSGVKEGMIYLQVTRGESPRNHAFPAGATPTVLFYARKLPPAPLPGEGPGQKLITLPDERWKRCWIKSIALLPNVLAKNEALAAGADEAVFVEEGFVSECSASNLFAVIKGEVVTAPIGPKVLPGITRLVLLQIAQSVGIKMIERPLRLEELREADEVFITSTTRELNWVGDLDGRAAGGGRCGPITRRLHAAYRERVREELGDAKTRSQVKFAGRT